MRLVDRVALVTGGSRGIGLEVALRLAQEGCHVAVAARQLELLEKVAQRVQDIGCQALALRMDVTKPRQVAQGFTRLMKRFHRLDILVNNAGVGYQGPLEQTPLEQINEMLDVNLLGTIECCRRAIPIMKKQGEGCIINIASMAGTVGVPDMAVYAASKWAVRGLGLSLSQELRKENIRVHNLCPGSVDTEFSRNFARGDAAAQVDPELLLKPDDIAQAVIYLATLNERSKVEELTIGARLLWMSR